MSFAVCVTVHSSHVGSYPSLMLSKIISASSSSSALSDAPPRQTVSPGRLSPSTSISVSSDVCEGSGEIPNARRRDIGPEERGAAELAVAVPVSSD
mmetsp:Transcript_58652/g.138125  ORF Transcript_58652/g.138125 Transcript_58652/m.138125 type:complete len:96 (+) Transcript_58652:61-348(+)|eukprot:CAMPEP_0175812128 /NCGR_PEP_ID=MMETSP0107_2-20121207/4210_1 /TAXON_ID=195067 ORGANISM="Goniomonas pacifica, Strain CCMP1869" /NCGR_SAMPLE_ID=MMETSP0107_2 /ASSEMBLY_ACC=CAM_ASM_000203 /LENGTH=95 /DNA_ID=CAMNT_0017123967 /DNA_START=18 /DNA_END=305 /DNA_ORIENTATION=+